MVKWVNEFGLLLNILGVVILFFFGPPQPSFEPGIGIGLEDGTPIGDDGKTVRDHNIEVRRNKRIHERFSQIGLALILIGFTFQLVAAVAA
jgi:hypothetical protein